MTTDLRIGMQVMHNGVAMELLYRKDHYQGMEIWRTKLLFVEPRERDELFEPNDRISFLHSKTMRAGT